MDDQLDASASRGALVPEQVPRWQTRPPIAAMQSMLVARPLRWAWGSALSRPELTRGGGPLYLD